MKRTRIIMAESHELIRKSLAMLLATYPGLNVISEVSNGKELVDLLKQTEADVVLLDIDVPVMDAKTALDIIVKRFPDTKVIALGSKNNPSLVSEYMSHGAKCFLSKDCSVETLVNAINRVATEGYYFNDLISKAILDSFLKEKTIEKSLDDIVFNSREKEIMKKICDGKTNREIAVSLHLSASTIDFHRSRIYSKAKCNNVAQLLRFALKKGIVELS